ncbi:hypothetical protein Rhal01_03536 [Rubritalea halochordaticola]|uniref:Uncharacterized protein n=1 Tax=Rubritalea halochordaticola TaxID=714537 RepID=A0ABP9V3V1_9BACT
MAQQFLDGTQVASRLQYMSSEIIAQYMTGHSLMNSAPLAARLITSHIIYYGVIDDQKMLTQ